MTSVDFPNESIFFGMLSGYLPDAARLNEWGAFTVRWHSGLAVLVSLYGLYFATGCRPFGEASLLEV